MKVKKIALLGGSHFIGYHLMDTLYNSGHDVTIFNRGITDPPKPFPREVKWINGDRNNPKTFASLFEKEFDVVFDINGYKLRHVKPIVRKYRHRIGHYIFCSTTKVYDIPPKRPFNETSRRTLTPNTYGGDKALIEDFLIEQYQTYGWPVSILQPQGVFGSYDLGFTAQQMGSIYHRIINGLPIPVKAGANYRLNLLYINDLVQAFIRSMEQRQSHGKSYCVAGDDICSLTEFIKESARACNKWPDIKMIDAPKYEDMEFGISWTDCDMVADNSKIKKELNVEFTTLEKGLEKTFIWLNKFSNPSAYGSFRGERFIMKNRPIPMALKIFWELQDKLKFFIIFLKHQYWFRGEWERGPRRLMKKFFRPRHLKTKK